MQPDVELREVEAEELDAPPQFGEPAARDPRAAILLEAPSHHVDVVEQGVGVRVALVAEPPPDERELAPVRLELVLRADRGGVLGELALVARDRLLELARDRDEGAMHRERDRELAHVAPVTLERELPRSRQRLEDRVRARVRISVHVAAD